MLQSGDTLAGYRIESVAGVGGMGVVYRATQTSLDRPVALKVLASTLVGNRTFRERFRREGRHAAALDHPNIIPVYEAGESNGLMFIAMRLVDGPSLADLIARNEVSGREALRVVGAIASALDAAHEAGLVHRDIKPQNILLTKAGHPYLADFGITKGTDHGGLTHSGDFVGSLNYVAPEQIEGKDVTGASDIYSLTAVLFQCLCGDCPYQRDSDAGLMHAHLSAPPPTLSERGIVATENLEMVFETGMAKVPRQRYATASALVEACREALSSADATVLDSAPAFAPTLADEADAPSEPQAEATQPDQVARAAPRVRASEPPAEVDFTAAERQPAAAPSDEQAPAPPVRRVATATLAAIGVTLLVAPVAGYALGRDEPVPASTKVRSATLTLEHDAAWTTSTGGIDGLKLDQAITLQRSDGVKLAAGRMPSYAAGFDPVPRALRERFSARSPMASIRLGESTAARHAVALGSGQRLWLALVPDTKGWVAIACEGSGAGPAACPAVATSLRLSGATPVSLGPDTRVATEISSAIDNLNEARSGASSRLRARSTRVRARAARRAAAAHARAARTLTDLGLRLQERPVVATLARTLRGQAQNLTRLAAAAARRRDPAYDAARTAIDRGERRVRAALQRLRSIGYRSG